MNVIKISTIKELRDCIQSYYETLARTKRKINDTQHMTFKTFSKVTASKEQEQDS